MDTPFLEMRDITKRFPGVIALDSVSITVNQGEIMGLVGENGAGKSTLVKILTGVLEKDQGQIKVNGNQVAINNPQDARKNYISIIHQELNVISNLTIAENIFLGVEKRKKKVFVNTEEMDQATSLLLQRIGLDQKPDTLVSTLSIAQQQMVEVAKALSFDARLIVMDEPTSSLSQTEVKILLDIIRTLKKNGVSIIFISHRLDEVFEIADSVTVMRDGKMIAKLTGNDINETNIVSLMVGRTLGNLMVKEDVSIGDVVLKVSNLSDTNLVKNVSFFLRKGEILGFSGLVGSGRTEVMNALFGVSARTSGEIWVDGKLVYIRSPQQAVDNGIGYVTEDRKSSGLILGMSIKENVTIAHLKYLRKVLFIDKALEYQEVASCVDQLKIKTPSCEQKVKNLSGGNQQKVVIAKWLMTKPKILIMDEPTRGIDVGAKKEVHHLMTELTKLGIAIILISSEMPEVIDMSNRIVVMHEGRISGELSKEEATQESIMSMAIANNSGGRM